MDRWNIRPRMLVMHRNSNDGKQHLARVEKINPKWIVIQYESGERWNSSPASLEPAPEGTDFNIDEAVGLEIGDPVRVINGRYAGEQIWVVLDVRGGTYKLAKLRKSGNRFLRGMPGSDIALIPEGEVHA